MEKIKICSHHQEKEKTPLIWTFAFRQKEYWCPYCGYTEGMFGAGENVELTKILTNRLKKYKKKSRAFLSARSSIICAYLTINGERRTFDSLPPQTRSYYKKKARSWKYKRKQT